MEEMVPNSGSVELVTASCAWSPTAIRPIWASSTVTSTFQESVLTITNVGSGLELLDALPEPVPEDPVAAPALPVPAAPVPRRAGSTRLTTSWPPSCSDAARAAGDLLPDGHVDGGHDPVDRRESGWRS